MLAPAVNLESCARGRYFITLCRCLVEDLVGCAFLQAEIFILRVGLSRGASRGYQNAFVGVLVQRFVRPALGVLWSADKGVWIEVLGDGVAEFFTKPALI